MPTIVRRHVLLLGVMLFAAACASSRGGLDTDPSGGRLCPGADTASVAAPALTLKNGDPGVTSLNRNVYPSIPMSLFVPGRRGRAEASVVIDTAGRVEPASAVVHASTEPAWANSVCVTLPKLRFAPIRVQGTPVRARILMFYEYYVDPNARMRTPPATGQTAT